MKSSYNIHAAIEMRSSGISDDQGETHILDFKTSVKLAKDETFMWGWGVPDDLEVWQAIYVSQEYRMGCRVTKHIYQKYRREYREYLRRCGQPLNLTT